MPYVPIRQLGSGGLAPDTPATDLPPNMFTNVVNGTFRHGKLSKSPGWQSVNFATDDPDPGDNVYWFQSWRVVDAIYTALFGAGKILIWDGNTLSTATTSIGADNTWTTDILGEYVIACNGVDDPIYNDQADGSNWSILPGWNDTVNGAPGVTTNVIRSYKSHLFALGVDGQPYTVYVSDIAKFGNMPDNWATTDLTSFASSYDLQASDGPIVDGAVLGDSLIVYTTRAAYAFTATGNIKAPFTTRRLFTRGLAAVEAVKRFENMHFCVDDKSIYAHDGSSIQRIADNRVEEFFFGGDLANTRTIKTAIDEDNNELIIYYAAKGADDVSDEAPATKALVWSWVEDTWSYEDFGVPIYCIKQSSSPGASQTWETLETEGITWDFLDNNGLTWQDLEESSSDNRVFQLQLRRWSERGVGSTRDGVDYYAFAERRYIDLDEVRQTNESAMSFSRLLPQIDGSGEGIFFEIGTSRAPYGTVNWHGPRPWVFNNDQYKVDVRGTGRYLSWRVGTWQQAVQSPSGGTWELSSIDLEGDADGLR